MYNYGADLKAVILSFRCPERGGPQDRAAKVRNGGSTNLGIVLRSGIYAFVVQSGADRRTRQQRFAMVVTRTRESCYDL